MFSCGTEEDMEEVPHFKMQKDPCTEKRRQMEDDFQKTKINKYLKMCGVKCYKIVVTSQSRREFTYSPGPARATYIPRWCLGYLCTRLDL